VKGARDGRVAGGRVELGAIVLVVAVGGGDDDLETVARLARILGRLLVQRGTPENALDGRGARRVGVAQRVLVGW
jgi:hypothetical protein